jgi:hypothetical protein
MMAPAAVVTSIGMSSCAARRSLARRAARCLGSRCCSTVVSLRGRGRGRALCPDRSRQRRASRSSVRRSASGRSSASWRVWRWRAQRQREVQQPIREET